MTTKKEIVNMALAPKQKEYEKWFLSYCLHESNKLFKSIDIDETIFYYSDHICIISAMLKLYEDNKPVLPDTVIQELKERDELEKAGGVSYISALIDNVPFQTSPERIYIMLMDYYELRKVFMLIDAIHSEPTKYYDKKKLYRKLDEALKLITIDEPFILGSDLKIDTLQSSRIVTHLAGLDDIVFIREGQLILIAAKTSQGKTSFMMSMAERMSEYNPLFFSVEMSASDIAIRLLSMHDDKITMDSLQRTPEKYINNKIKSGTYYNFSARLEVHKLAMMVNAAIRKYHSKIIFIDYLQLLKIELQKGYQFSETNRISCISHKLKEIARDNKIAVVAASQLSRDREGEENKKGTLGKLKYSGDLECDSDCVICLNFDTTTGKDTIEILKQRQGKRIGYKNEGIITTMKFDREHCRWK